MDLGMEKWMTKRTSGLLMLGEGEEGKEEGMGGGKVSE